MNSVLPSSIPMSSTSSWIPVENIKVIFNLELLFLYLFISLVSFAFYKFFLKGISEKRHKNLKSRFKMLPTYWFVLSFLFVITSLVEIFSVPMDQFLIWKMNNYLLLFAAFYSGFVLVRLFQIAVYCYLFFANMSHGIPRLIANVLTFFFSVALFVLTASFVFKINVAALATTSAVFSIILGFALQDTIGNLFAGLSLQIDRSLKIGDWVEVIAETGIWAGQVQEITWRATYLQGFSNEIYMVPNRLMASAKVSFQMPDRNSRRLSHIFRFGYDQDFSLIKQVMLQAIRSIEGISLEPMPRAILLESLESSVSVGLFYSIEDYSKRYLIGDQVLQKVVHDLTVNNISVQVAQIQYKKPAIELT